MSLSVKFGIVLVLLLFYANQALSDSVSCQKAEENCVKVGSWSASIAIGLGVRENPVLGRDNMPLVLLPTISYYGERFTIENFNFSYLLSENKRHSFHFIAEPSLEYMFFNDWSLGNLSLEDSGAGAELVDSDLAFEPTPGLDGEVAEPVLGGEQPSGRQADDANAPSSDDLRERNLAYLGGVEYGLYLGPMYFGAQLLQDLSFVHKGQELRLAASYHTELGKHKIKASTGLLWKSGEVMDYYYGIGEGEFENGQFSYQAQADFSYFARLSWSTKLSEKWSLVASSYYRVLSDEAANSPLIDKDGIATVYIGGVYHF